MIRDVRAENAEIKHVLHERPLLRELEPEKLADLIILLYEHYAETEKKVEKETVSKYLRLVA